MRDIYFYFQFFVSLIALVNPIGVIPVYYSLTSNFPQKQQSKMMLITCFTISIVLLISFFFGNAVLSAFKISIDSFRIAGGVVVCGIALTMINGEIGKNKMNSQEMEMDASYYTNLAIVPLAIPLMAGPGSISAMIIFANQATCIQDWIFSSITVVLFSIFCYFLLSFSKPLMRKLGQTGANVVTRIMGLILLALGVEIIVTALKNFGLISTTV